MPSQGERLDKFYSSVKSRLLVAEVIARIQVDHDDPSLHFR
jgi:hypothetical protein